jgi:winged helix DNA-binding protein
MRADHPSIGGGGGSGDVLVPRALNRALLERQMLLRRSELSTFDAIEHLVGMQAQSPLAPYVGLWTRLEGFQPDELVRLMNEREVVRIALMRNTVHLVTGEDCLRLRPLVQVILDRDLRVNTTFAPRLRNMDIDGLTAAGRALVEERPRTNAELGALLQEQWPNRDAASLAFAIRSQVPLVQVPPRGIWGKGGQVRCTSAEAWLGRPLDRDPSLENMIMRYLGAFGPATVTDVQQWCGLTRLREAVERLRPRLARFRDEAGNELFDLPDAPRPHPDTPAPVRFLPEYDNLFVSHADRTRVISESDLKRLRATERLVRGSVLVDGFFRGLWQIRRRRGVATLHIESYGPLSNRDRDTVVEEGGNLLTFAASEAKTREFEFTVRK